MAIGGSLILFLATAGLHAPLVDIGVLDSPPLTSFAFLMVVGAMAAGLTRDVARTATLSAEVKSSEHRWRTLAESVQLLVVGLHRDRRINYVNPCVAQLTGVARDELLGRGSTRWARRTCVRDTDIPLLVQAFVRRFAAAQGKPVERIPQPVMDEFLAYDWPGNIRELSNVIERSVITSTEGTLRLAARLSGGGQPSPASTNDHRGTLHQVEKAHIEQVLKETSRPGRCILYACAMDEETVEELKGHFGIVAEDLRSEVRAVAEGQALAAQRLDSGLAHLEGRMDRGFGELQSMIRLSYTEIDRRFSELEGEVSDLRSRVERLETREA